MRVLCIVPAYNEEVALPFVIEDLRKTGFDILVVDDGSNDHTFEVAHDAGVKVLRLPFNLGIGGAVQTGFKFALSNNYDVAIQFDGDYQHRADQIYQLLIPIEEKGFDLVIGSRHLAGGYSFPILRRIGGLWFAKFLGLLTGLSVTDPTSGFRGYSRRAMEFFVENYPDDFPEVESILLAVKKGLFVTEVPALMRQRHGGESSISGVLTVYYMIKVTIALLISYLKKV